MPAIYAHYSFGKKVYKRMPEYMKKIVDEYFNEFITGLQGPDPLFFYNPFMKNKVGALGSQIHDEDASEFLERALKVLHVTGIDSPEGSYILGFICHFMLDSSCHEYVERMVKETGISHTEQETEFDRYVMEKDLRDPFGYPCFELFDDSKEMADTMSVFYAGISTHAVHESLKRMWLEKRLTYCPGNIKRSVLFGAAKLVLGKDNSMIYQIMPTEANPECEPICRELGKRLWKAAPECAKELDYFVRRSMTTGHLSKRMERNFE